MPTDPQVSCSKSPERSSKRTRSVAKPHQDRDTVSAHVRCKLSFPNEDEKDGVNDDKVPKAQTSALKGPEEDGPLPPMPDLSQRSLSQPSPPSPTLPSVPSAASQVSHFVSLCVSFVSNLTLLDGFSP